MKISAAATNLKNLVALDTTAREKATDAKAVVPTTNPKADPLKTALLKDIVNANEHANRLPGSSTNSNVNGERYGTSSFGHPHIDSPDRFGLGKDPSERNPIDVINQRAGWGFNPQRDLRVNPGDAASKPGESKQIRELKKENEDLKKEVNDLKKEIKDIKNEVKGLEFRTSNNEIDISAIFKKLGDWLKNPNPDAPDNSSGGPNDPLINNLGSNRRIRQPFVDPTGEQQFGPSGVMRARGQATDPNPDVDPNTGAAMKLIRSTSDAVTDPMPAINAALWKGVVRG